MNAQVNCFQRFGLFAPLLCIFIMTGCASRQGTHEGDLLDNKVTAQRVESELRKSGKEFRHVKVDATKEGVILTGRVKTEEEKSRAEDVAKRVQRKMDFKNELSVGE